MEIRLLNRNDFLRVSVLFKNIRETLSKPGHFKTLSPEMLEDYLVNGIFYGAFKRGELVGVSGLELDKFPYETRDDFGIKQENIGEIMFMAVRQDNRGKGIITKINNELIKKAKALGAKAVGISVHPDNMPAIKAFCRLGKIEFVGFNDHSYDEPNVVYCVKI